MKKLFSIILLVPVLSWSAYGNSQKPRSDARVEVIDGIEFIHNSGIPMYPNKTVTFVEDLSISGEDKDGNIILFEPRLSLVDDNENIYFKETKDHVIKVFGSDGKYVKTIGAKGSGPGEFQDIRHFAITKDGKLVVLDGTARRTSFFDSSGHFLKSFQWKTDYYQFILIKSSSYIIGETVRGEDRQPQKLYVKEIDFDGKEIQSYGEFTLIKFEVIRKDDATGYMNLPVSISSLFTGDENRSLFYHCLNNKYLIEVYDASGKPLRKIDRPYVPVLFTKKDAAEYRARFENIAVSEMIKKAARDMKMPKVKSVVKWMYVDDESNLWVQTNETKKEEDKILTAFDIFNPDGHYYAKVWTEFIPFIFKKGKMYRMDTDQDTEYKTLKRYKVVWN